MTGCDSAPRTWNFVAWPSRVCPLSPSALVPGWPLYTPGLQLRSLSVSRTQFPPTPSPESRLSLKLGTASRVGLNKSRGAEYASLQVDTSLRETWLECRHTLKRGENLLYWCGGLRGFFPSPAILRNIRRRSGNGSGSGSGGSIAETAGGGEELSTRIL